MKQFHKLTPTLALQLANPRSWVASVYPAIFGELYCISCGYTMTVWTAVLLLAACICMQSAVNTFNDYFDFIKGTDSAEDHVEVRDAVLIYGNINPRHAFYLAWGFLGAAFILALPVLLTAGPAPWVIGVIGGIVVCLYSGGSVPISYLPIGELVSGIVMGVLIPLGIVAAVSDAVPVGALIGSLPLMLGIGLIMMTNNISDIEKDQKARRKTFPALVGRARATRVYRLAVAAWLLLICCIPMVYMPMGMGWILSPLLLWLFARRAFAFLLGSPLIPEDRVNQMKGIVKANIAGNGIYLLVLAAFCIKGGVFYG